MRKIKYGLLNFQKHFLVMKVANKGVMENLITALNVARKVLWNRMQIWIERTPTITLKSKQTLKKLLLRYVDSILLPRMDKMAESLFHTGSENIIRNQPGATDAAKSA